MPAKVALRNHHQRDPDRNYRDRDRRDDPSPDQRYGTAEHEDNRDSQQREIPRRRLSKSHLISPPSLHEPLSDHRPGRIREIAYLGPAVYDGRPNPQAILKPKETYDHLVFSSLSDGFVASVGFDDEAWLWG